MDTAWIGLGVVIAGLAVVRLTLFGQGPSFRSDDSPPTAATLPAARRVALSSAPVATPAGRAASGAGRGDVHLGLAARIRSVLLLTLLAAGAGAAAATLLGLALIVAGLTLWG